MKLPLFEPASDWRPPRVSDLPSWREAKRVCVDVETKDPHLKELGPGVRRGAEVVGVGFAIEDGPSFYVPLRHELGDNVQDEGAAWRYFADQAADFTGTIVGANLQYDLDFMAEAGVVYRRAAWFRDVQIADPLIDDLHLRYNLEIIAQRRGVPGKDESMLREAARYWGLHPKKHLWRMPARHVGPYGEQDVRLPLTVIRRQERRIEDEGLQEIYDMESRLLPVLLKMRRRGVRVDFDELDRVEQMTHEREKAALAEIKRLTGHGLTQDDTTKAEALAPVLRHLSIAVPLTPKTKKASIDDDLLNSIDHPVGELIRTAKRYNKLRGTFVEGRRTHAINGRVHPTFNQLRGESKKDTAKADDEAGARYGRLSCSDPNLQQEPNRGELKKIWRKVYVPEPGCEWACLDYSQQEPRWLTHYAELLKLPGAREAAERYRTDPSTDNHQMSADITGLPRDDAKQVYLAICYGMGGGKLCVKLGLPTVEKIFEGTGETYLGAGPEGQATLDTFDEKMPFVRMLAKRVRMKANQVGYIVTAGGRHCHFPPLPGGQGGFDWTFKALNRLIQGSSGDQMKKAMVLADEAGFRLQLQVHDELDLSIENRQQARDLAEIMLNALPCNVPAKVDIEVGPTWAEIENIDKAAA